MFLIPALIFFLTAAVLVILGRLWPDFGYPWPIAALGGSAAWLAGLLTQFFIPLPGEFLVWPAQQLFEPALVFGWDPLSWAYALAIASLALGVVITEIQRAPSADGSGWAACLFTAGLGFLAAFGGNFFTYVVLFSALDLAQILFYFRRLSEGSIRSSWISSRIAGRLLGTGLVVYSLLLGPASISPSGAVGAGWLQIALFLTGISLRLALFFPSEGNERNPVTVGLNLIPAAAALALIPRWFGVFSPASAFITGGTIVVVLVGAVQALRVAVSSTEREGRQAWLAAAGALVALAALRGQMQVGASWGVVFLLSGGVLALYQPASRWLVVVPLIALWSISGLPFSPLWEGMGLFSLPLSTVLLLGILIHGLILAGYFKYISINEQIASAEERWVRLIAPLGMAVLLITQQWIAWFPGRAPGDLSRFPWWPAVLAIVISLVIWWWLRLGDAAQIIREIIQASGGALALITRPLAGIPVFISRATGFLTTILEGEGGVLWALLLLTLLLSILAQFNPIGLGNGN